MYLSILEKLIRTFVAYHTKLLATTIHQWPLSQSITFSPISWRLRAFQLSINIRVPNILKPSPSGTLWRIQISYQWINNIYRRNTKLHVVLEILYDNDNTPDWFVYITIFLSCFFPFKLRSIRQARILDSILAGMLTN